MSDEHTCDDEVIYKLGCEECKSLHNDKNHVSIGKDRLQSICEYCFGGYLSTICNDCDETAVYRIYNLDALEYENLCTEHTDVLYKIKGEDKK